MQVRDLFEAASPAEQMVRRFYRMVADPQNAKYFAHVDVQLEAQSPDMVTILDIHSKKQQHGIGTEVMQGICRLADQYQVDLELQVKPMGIPYDKLVEWYKRFGFSPDRASNGAWMVRAHRT
jgi:hypothetical protein